MGYDEGVVEVVREEVVPDVVDRDATGGMLLARSDSMLTRMRSPLSCRWSPSTWPSG